MLIDDPKQIHFDFCNNYKESMTALADDILFASGREHFPIDDWNADLLIELIHRQQVGVFAQKYSLEKDPDIDYQKVNEIVDLIGKRTPGLISHALRIYKDHKPLKRRNEYNALYYPDLKVYVRFGNLRPVKLLDMLTEENCNGVILFRDVVDSDTEDRFFIFALGNEPPCSKIAGSPKELWRGELRGIYPGFITKEEYRAIMETAREKHMEALHEALQASNAGREHLFPEVSMEEMA